MKGGFYIRLAKDGIVKNRKLYFPYILTCICMVMIFYIVYYLGFCADLKRQYGGDMLQTLLGIGVYIVAVFALIFLYYTNSFLIRRRQKEFGLYNILGMGKRNLVKILVWENLLTAAVSIAAGIALGILFSKLAELAALKLLNGSPGFSIYLGARPVIVTVVLFLVVFLLIMLRAVFSIFRLRPMELLKSENVGEKPPKANWVLALIGAVLLAGAYYLAVAVIDPMSALVLFFLAVILVIIATYLLFIAGSVVLCRILQKRKRYYYQMKHFVSLSSMVYRMKRNGAGLASICILSTMVLVTVSSTVCLFAQTGEFVERRYPHDITALFGSNFGTDDYAETQAYRDAVAAVLDEQGVSAEHVEDFHYYSTAGYLVRDELSFRPDRLSEVGLGEVESIRSVYMIPLDDYNRLSGADRSLRDGEVLLYPYKTDYGYDTFSIEGCGSWEVEVLDEQPFPVGSAQADVMGSMFLVVRDLDVMRQVETVNNQASEEWNTVGISFIRESYGFDLPCSDQEQRKIYDAILERFSVVVNGDGEVSGTGDGTGDGTVNETGNGTEEVSETGSGSGFPSYYVDSKAYGRADSTALYGGLFFLGVMMGAVFLFGTVLIMYYKQISEGYEDQDRFDILMKVGMSRREIRQSISSQVLTVFFLPLVTAGIHLAFAFPLISKILMLMSGTNETLLLAVTASCYLVFALFYIILYVVTSRSYYGIVSGGKR